ncbi:MAG: UDP-2,4-diacetamido-2,4,6-trideoxy-beta-L-altropyranose hydrolase [Nitrospiraceae bacterium]|nr:UDP-2,4-diacetamido-2,4,6-trideoxy-beta-L-altropyranose hydrolase [Nitrospiraceae bacterium]
MKLVIRADATAQMGTGHLMRCLALGQAVKDRGVEVSVITNCSNPGLLEKVRQEDFNLHYFEPLTSKADIEFTRKLVQSHPGSWVVLDGPLFDSSYQKSLKAAGCNVVSIDDMAKLSHYWADIIINQNLHGEDMTYSCEPYTRVLAGADYVILRRQFLYFRGIPKRIFDKAERILIMMGGSDPENITGGILSVLSSSEISGLNLTVVAGAANTYIEEIKAIIGASNMNARLIQNAPNMPELMEWADMAITSGGTTVWELAFMGVPSIVITTSEIEEYLVSGLQKKGLFWTTGWFEQKKLIPMFLSLINDKVARNEMSLKSKALIDGFGCERILKTIFKES